MKTIYYLFISILLAGCYADENEIVTSTDTAHNSSEMTRMAMSISMHDASFDDKIDNTSCFSLIFPYQIHVNSELETISSRQDLLILNDEDSFEIVYPVNIVSFNYEEYQVTSSSQFNLIKASCEMDISLTPNSCLNIQYPINIKEYNELTEVFESLQFADDRDFFRYLDMLHDTDFYEIDYPMSFEDLNSNTLRINSNSEFEQTYNSYFESCE